jgi:hypothetical protein
VKRRRRRELRAILKLFHDELKYERAHRAIRRVLRRVIRQL